jgi:hypothetical protein
MPNTDPVPPITLPADPLSATRAEYDQLWQNLRAGVTILWEAFKTYFTVIGLLFAALGFFQGSKVPPGERYLFSVMLSIAGWVITDQAAPGITRILQYQKQFLDRAKEIEQELSSAVSTQAFELFTKPSEETADKLTFKVFSYFKVGWLVAACYFTFRLALMVVPYLRGAT